MPLCIHPYLGNIYSMKKLHRLPCAVVLVLVLAALAPTIALAGSPATLSVLYFENRSPSRGGDPAQSGDPTEDHAWLSKGLADMLTTDLAATGGVRLVERERLELLLNEQELALSGLLDAANAPAIGAFLNAEALCYGFFMILENELRVDARVSSVQTGLVLAAASASGPLDQLNAIEHSLMLSLAAGLGLETVAAPVLVPTRALSSYYKGLDLMDKGRYADAVAFFGESVRAAPFFLKPGRSLEEAYKFLKDFRKQRYRREMNALAGDISALAERISAPVFYSFGDAIQNPKAFGFSDAAAVSDFYNKRPLVLNGETPVQAVWNLQNALSDLADKATEYFEDENLADRCREEILLWAKNTRKAYPDEPFLPEVLYQTAFVYREREHWAALRQLCEELMTLWPDFRMMWAVEGMYEDAIKRLENP